RIKASNQAAVRETIYKFGPISRMEMAKKLNLTFPTITTNVAEMLHEGILEEKEAEALIGGRGRRTMNVDYIPSSRIFMGMEMRRHASYATIIDLRGNTIGRKSRNVFHDDYRGAMEEPCSLSKELLKENNLSWNDICGMGFCLPGIVDQEKGVLEIHPRFKWKGINVRDDVREATGYQGPLCVLNNTCARVYGTSLFSPSAFSGADYVAYMYVGSGIKCPLVFSLKDHFGYIVGEGEVGHMVMNPSGPECTCGNHGCLESYASDSAIERNAHLAVERGESEILKSMGEDHYIAVEDIIKAKNMGDQVSRSLIDRAIEYLSLALANVNNFVKPDCVVVVSRLFCDEENRRLLEDDIRRNLSWNSILDYKLSFIDYKKEDGARGAGAAAIRDFLLSKS
ncbi:MAG: ROK family protein, partial [Candidatus Ornithospirochaeta sp.]